MLLHFKNIKYKTHDNILKDISEYFSSISSGDDFGSSDPAGLVRKNLQWRSN